MASNAQPSMSSTLEEEGARPQAGPLPQKRGEIGFTESVESEEGGGETGTEEGVLPERHPADTQLSPSQTTPPSQPSNDSASPDSPPLSSDASSTTKIPKNKLLSLFSKLALGGISIGSFLRLLIQLALLGGTLAAWVIITQHLLHGSPDFSSSPSPDSGNDASDDDNSGSSLGGSASIFVHVTFALAVLGQLIFLERCVFHMRAQRYAFKHPGATLPTSRSPSGRAGMGFAPWNRPSLPTYAAALAQSGLGTGDVEDNLIAIPPPPAYGNTRGSTLLLRGFLRNSLREAVTSRDSQHRMSVFSQRSSRPVSYHSQDGDAAERGDAARAMRLAETLQQLEEGNGSEDSHSRPSGDEGTNARSSISQGQ